MYVSMIKMSTCKKAVYQKTYNYIYRYIYIYIYRYITSLFKFKGEKPRRKGYNP